MENYTKQIISAVALFVAASQFVCAQGDLFATGCVIDDDAYSKIPQNVTLLTRDYSILPSSVSLLKYCPEVGNQNPYGTCTSWATTYAARTIAEAVKYGWTSKAQITDESFAPIFIYHQIKGGTQGCSTGTRIDDALKLLRDKGAPKYKHFRVLCTDYIPNQLYTEASNFKIDDFTCLFGGVTPYDAKINKTKKALAEERPVIVAMKLPDSFHKAGEYWQYRQGDPVNGGNHAMCVVGYDDNKNGGSFLFMNSWGKKWGKDGFTWVTYKDFHQFVHWGFEMYVKKWLSPLRIDPLPQPQPKPRPVKNKLAGSMSIKLSTGETMDVSLISSTIPFYQAGHSFISGTRCRFYISNNEPAYVYVIGSDLENNVSCVFPPEEGISPALTYKSNNIAIPNENWYIEMDNTKGKDYFCVLYSMNELPIKDVILKIRNGSGLFSHRLQKALSDKLASVSDIKFEQKRISFEATTYATVVPLIVEVAHQ